MFNFEFSVLCFQFSKNFLYVYKQTARRVPMFSTMSMSSLMTSYACDQTFQWQKQCGGIWETRQVLETIGSGTPIHTCLLGCRSKMHK